MLASRRARVNRTEIGEVQSMWNMPMAVHTRSVSTLINVVILPLLQPRPSPAIPLPASRVSLGPLGLPVTFDGDTLESSASELLFGSSSPSIAFPPALARPES